MAPVNAEAADDTSGRDFARALGARLRAVRGQQHLSLQGVERKSGGQWKAVVVGSYERGDRAISVHRLAELAAFYEVPLADLLPEEGPAQSGTSGTAPLAKLVLNVRRVRELTDAEAEPLVRMVSAIQRRRHHPASEHLTIRNDDLAALALVYDTTPQCLTERLVHWQVLAPESVILDGEP
jgi:transcriptional regulator with XRE-family HTH domain